VLLRVGTAGNDPHGVHHALLRDGAHANVLVSALQVHHRQHIRGREGCLVKVARRCRDQALSASSYTGGQT
jgi:hypothetical protein